jgi:rfaE bifunctional protein kinase chain/domain
MSAEYIKESILPKFRNVKVLVIGDLMLDQYWWGNVSRISQEAPIPVVEINKQTGRMGGAANVANNIVSIGATPLLIGIIGKDPCGQQLQKLIQSQSISTSHLIADPSRPTTTKTRIIGHNQHIVRIDHESTAGMAPAIEKKVLAMVTQLLPTSDAVLLEDYNKGLFTPALIADIIRLARKYKKPITVDPKFDNFFAYKGATVFKPNVREVESALGIKVTAANLAKTCATLAAKMNLGCVVITLSEKGLVYLQKNRAMIRIPALERKVHDVSGAGDTVIATLTTCLAAGLTIHTAASIANNAGGAVCEEVGVVPVTPAMLLKSPVEN